MSEINLNQSILRIFEVRAKPGKAQQLKSKLSSTSIAVVDGKPGNLGYLFGEDISSAEDDLVFISVWESLDAIKLRFGDSWQESYLPEGYEDMIESCAIKHIRFDGKLTSI